VVIPYPLSDAVLGNIVRLQLERIRRRVLETIASRWSTTKRQ
jgi:hypothetical protein